MTEPDYEAVEEASAPPAAKVKTVTVLWRGRTWQVRNKPGMTFLDAFDNQHLALAAKSIVGDRQYASMLALDVDIEGDDGLNGFFEACNEAWGLNSGN